MIKRNAAFHQRHAALAQLVRRQPACAIQGGQRIINTCQRSIERPAPHEKRHLLQRVLGNRGQIIRRQFRLADGHRGQYRSLFNLAPRAIHDQFFTRAKPRGQRAGHLVFQAIKGPDFGYGSPACRRGQYRLTKTQLPGNRRGFLIGQPFKGHGLGCCRCLQIERGGGILPGGAKLRCNTLGVLGVRQQGPLHQARVAHLIRQAKGGHQHLQNTGVSQRLIDIRRGIQGLAKLRQSRQRDGVFLFADKAFFFLTGFGDTAEGNHGFPGAGRRGSVTEGEHQRILALLAK